MPDDPAPINFCVHCGEYLRSGAGFCPKCGASVAGATSSTPAAYQGPPGTWQPSTGQPVQSKKPFYAGMLLTFSGIIGFVTAASVYLDREAIVAEAESIYGQAIPGAEGIIIALAIGWVVIGVMALAGAYASFQRKWFGLALIGAIFGLFTGGVLFLEGSIMGLIALVLLIMCRAEFKR
jgi:hypothetical protein